MNAWLCVAVVAFATLLVITETKSSAHIIHKRGLDVLDIPFEAEGEETPVLQSANAADTFDVPLHGRYSWVLLYDIDNLNNSQPITQKYKMTKTVKTSNRELTKVAYAAAIKLKYHAEAGLKIKLISASVDFSLDGELSAAYDKTTETTKDTETTEEITKEYIIGPNSHSKMYRLIYTGPGVSYLTDTVSTDNTISYKNVVVNCKLQKVNMIKDIRVVYTPTSVDRPSNSINVYPRGNPDVNGGFNGEYVWLVPVWTQKVDEAVSRIDVVLQKEVQNNYRDLAAGTGGKYRYLKMLHDEYSESRLGRVALIRSPVGYPIFNRRQSLGFDDCTDDINEGRAGDYLHLCWNTVSAD